MQKLMFAMLGAVCVLASAQYRSNDNDGHKLEIKHSWDQKSYKKGDDYGKGDGDSGYGKRQEGHSSRYFEMQTNKGYESKYEPKYESKYESKYEPKKYEVYRSDDKYDNNDNSKKNDYKYETRYEPMIKYDSYKMDAYKSDNNDKYQDRYEPKKYEIRIDDYTKKIMDDLKKYETRYESDDKYESNDKYESKYDNKKNCYGCY